MKLFKKNQLIIYVIVLMLMTAGYLNYTTNSDQQKSVETAMQMEASDDMQLADIGDATLVNSNDVVPQNQTGATNTTNATDATNTANTANTSNTTMESTNTNAEVNGSNDSNTDSETTTDDTTVETSSRNNNDYFVKSKLERDTMYSQMIETYEKVLNSTNSLETQRQSATQEIQKINDTKNSIMICENLIKTKGFENSIIFVNGESISIIVGIEEIKPEEVAQIQNIIAREMKAKVENIHIATK